jgi:signal transduction histidine kinase/ligand-binding sensor domain-containing protein
MPSRRATSLLRAPGTRPARAQPPTFFPLRVTGWLLLAGVLLWPVPLPSEDGTGWTSVHHWRAPDGLPQNTINQVAQSADGYLWIATFRGLARFDGHRFKTFDRTSQPSLPIEQISAIGLSPAGLLYVGSDAGLVHTFDGATFTEVYRPATGRGASLFALAFDEAGEPWFLDREGILTRLRDGLTVPPPPAERNPRGPTQLARDPASGELYVLHLGKLSRLRGERLVSVPRPPELAGDALILGPARLGGIRIVTRTAVLHFDGEAWKVDFSGEVAAGESYTDLSEAADGRIIVATSTEGVFLLDESGRRARFDAASTLGDNWVRCVYGSDDHSVWVGTARAGLVRLRATDTELLEPPADWNRRPFKSVAPAGGGGVWAGTEGDGLYRFRGSDWERFNAGGLTNPYVWTVHEDRQGRVWIGTWGGGVFLFDEGSFRRMPSMEDPTASVSSIIESRDGSIWFGTTMDLWRLRPDGSSQRFGGNDPDDVLDIRSIVEGADGRIWVGFARGGLGYCDGATIEVLEASPRLASVSVTALHADPAGGLWIATLSDGLVFLRDGRATFLGEREGLPLCTIHHIVESGGILWFSSNRGILRVDLQALREVIAGERPSVDFLLVGSSSPANSAPLAGGAQPEACATADGILWFASSEGLLRHDPGIHVPTRLHAPVIEEVLHGGQMTVFPLLAESGKRGLTIAPGTERFAIRFSAPFSSDVAGPPLRFRLGDERSDWINADFDWSADFLKVPPGDYTFQVQASDGRGEVLETSLGITVAPFWWQRRSIQAAGIGLAGTILAAAVHLRARAVHRRRTQRIRRERALERERTRIARDIHDDLGASLTRIQLLTELTRRSAHPAEQGPQLEEIARMARDSTRRMDEIVWAVSPRHDSTESLADYLCSFAQSYLREAGIACRLDVPANLPRRSVFAAARHQLFLVVQEALTNIVKHSRAQRATVRMRILGEHLEIEIEDDGVGMPGQADLPPGRHGLGSMKSRLTELGGSCAILPGDHGGTRVHLRVPLQAPKEDDSDHPHS